LPLGQHKFFVCGQGAALIAADQQKSDVIAYQIRQSFRPGEITAEEANKVGYELAMRFTKGKQKKKSRNFLVPSSAVELKIT